MKTRIAIVTVLYGSDEVIPDFVVSLRRQIDVSLKIFSIDNSASASGTLLIERLAKEAGIDIVTVFNNNNLGVAEGNNQGIELAIKEGYEYILLSNNDIEFDSELLISNLLGKLKRNRWDAIVPKIYYHGTKNIIWAAGGEFNRLKALTPHYGDGQQDIGQYDSDREIEYSPTCFMLISTGVFRKIGLMDSKYFVYYDDADFLWRMKDSRMRVGYSASDLLLHKVSFSTGGQESSFSIKYNYRNRLYFIVKNYRYSRKIISLLWYFSAVVMKSIFLERGNSKAILDGCVSGLKLIFSK